MLHVAAYRCIYRAAHGVMPRLLLWKEKAPSAPLTSTYPLLLYIPRGAQRAAPAVAQPHLSFAHARRAFLLYTKSPLAARARHMYCHVIFS